MALLAPALAQVGNEVHVAYCREGPNLPLLQGTGAHLHSLASNGNHDPTLAWRIAALIRRLQPDVVQTWVVQMDVLAGAAALLQRIPVVLSERSSRELYVANWKTRLRLRIGRHASAIVGNSFGGLAYWQPHVRADSLHLVRNCIVTPVYNAAIDAAARSTLPQLAGRPLVLFAGRFSFEKNISGLIESMILVAQRRPDASVVMFGEGPERNAALRRVREAEMGERIVLPGFCAELDVWMRTADACVSVSHFEGHPNVVLEAAAAGCPLILSDIAAHREIFDTAGVAMVDGTDPVSVADAVVDALHNPQLARLRAAHARDVVSRWSLPSVVSAYDAVYRIVKTGAHK